MDADKVSPVDPDARFGTNNERRRYVFGYKLHVAVDAGSGLVRALVTTPANVQEVALAGDLIQGDLLRSEEHTSELQSLMRNSYAVFCLKKKKTQKCDEKQ